MQVESDQVWVDRDGILPGFRTIDRTVNPHTWVVEYDGGTLVTMRTIDILGGDYELARPA